MTIYRKCASFTFRFVCLEWAFVTFFMSVGCYDLHIALILFWLVFIMLLIISLCFYRDLFETCFTGLVHFFLLCFFLLIFLIITDVLPIALR